MKGLYVVAAVTMAGVSSVFALLAELEKRYDIPTASLGYITGAAFVSALITQLWFARYADRGHAERVLRSGILAAAGGLLWFAAATELWQFIAARSLLGAGVGMIIPPARRAIVLAADGNQGELLGTFYAAYLTGFVFGPPVAGALTELTDVRMPFLVLGLCTAATLTSIARLRIPAAEARAGEVDKRVLRRLIRSRPVVAALLVVMSFRYSIGVFEPLWAPYLDDLGASTMTITLSLTGFALPMLLVARAAGRLSDRFGPRLTSLLSAAATVPLMAAYGYVGVVPVLMAMAVPHGLLEAIQSPGTQAAVADAAPRDDASAAQGLAEAAGSGAAAFGAFTAAPLFDRLGSGPAWLIAGAVMTALLATSAVLDRPVSPVNRTGPQPVSLG
ncbi:MAG: MFS transporter [Actinomycetia bacterium]|nr:MFS transporter [Actinomycetes bacterium]